MRTTEGARPAPNRAATSDQRPSRQQRDARTLGCMGDELKRPIPRVVGGEHAHVAARRKLQPWRGDAADGVAANKGGQRQHLMALVTGEQRAHAQRANGSARSCSQTHNHARAVCACACGAGGRLPVDPVVGVGLLWGRTPIRRQPIALAKDGDAHAARPADASTHDPSMRPQPIHKMAHITGGQYAHLDVTRLGHRNRTTTSAALGNVIRTCERAAGAQ
eukprot:3620014-Prymnesium_polylepis.1